MFHNYETTLVNLASAFGKGVISSVPCFSHRKSHSAASSMVKRFNQTKRENHSYAPWGRTNHCTEKHAFQNSCMSVEQ